MLVGQLASGDGTPQEPPAYPTVQGTLGESLTRLQRAWSREAPRRVGCARRRDGSLCGSCAGSPELADDRAGRSSSRCSPSRRRPRRRGGPTPRPCWPRRARALDAGADAGEVSTERYQQIDAALDQVASDLAAQQAAAEQLAAEQAAADQAAADKAAAEQTAPAPAPATPKGKDKNPGKGNKDK